MIHQQSYLLAIETVGKVCGIAFYDAINGTPQLEYVLHVPNMHDAMLAELIRRAMNDLHITSSHISAIAVSEGPGSFTGVRIGMSFAKGWCADGKTSLISVPTFQAMFEAARECITDAEYSTLCICMKSHANVYYLQCFDIQSGKSIESIKHVSYDEAISILDDTMILIGDIHVENTSVKRIHHINGSHPRYIALLGLRMMLAANFTSPFAADPEYHAEFIPSTKEAKS
jgi:tRNA threonylcarbamoyl adenosine modification protein YeaZ